jgi:TonB family protein
MCVSANDIGPAAFGLLDPIIILPRSFLELEQDAQCAIVCHELLHVKRNDWLVTVIEELIGACLWFHPAVWWLLSQTKLAREQVVDAEVIRLTAAPDLYIDALLAMSNAHPDRVLSPAPLFLYKRHLIQRLRCLVTDSPISRRRIVASYASMGAVLAAAGCLAFMSFPLMSQPQIDEAASPEALSRQTSIAAPVPQRTVAMERVFRVGGGVTAPKLISRVDPQYPDSARENHTKGSVIVQGVVLTDGAMTVNRLLRSLNPELDRSALDAMSQWRFEPGRLRGAPVPVEIDAEVNFNLKP